MKKRLLAGFLAVMLLVSNLGTTSSAAETGDETVSLTSQEAKEEGAANQETEAAEKENSTEQSAEMIGEESSVGQLEEGLADQTVEAEEEGNSTDQLEEESSTEQTVAEESSAGQSVGAEEGEKDSAGQGAEEGEKDSAGQAIEDTKEGTEESKAEKAETGSGTGESVSVNSVEAVSARNRIEASRIQNTYTNITALNTGNLAYTFTTIDGGTATSIAQDKAKILFFFNSDCEDCSYTMENICASASVKNAEIIAIDVENNSAETVNRFKEEYGSEEITFCYDELTYKNSSAMWAYVRTANASQTQISYPVICYIDAENRYQYMTSSYYTGEEIEDILDLCCTLYQINYHLAENEFNHADNPGSFTAATRTITLKKPSREGYVFKGWYLDEAFEQPITKIVKGTNTNLDLYPKFVKELELVLPDKRTYLVGEKLDLSGGRITHLGSGQSGKLTNAMVKGFSSEEAGRCTVEVTYKGCKISFDVLILDRPEGLTGEYHTSLKEVRLPENEFGIFSWVDGSQLLTEAGESTYTFTFEPKDEYADIFTVRSDLSAEVGVYRMIGEDDFSLSVQGTDFTYNGYAYRPEVVVSFRDSGRELEAEHYTLRYEDNTNAGEATITVLGVGYYGGSFSGKFTINPAQLTIIAKDLTLGQGDELPAENEFEYQVIGLAKNDFLTEEPVCKTNAADTSQIGVFELIPEGAAAGNNYLPKINYISGRLRIAEERVGYTVSFELGGHGEEIEEYVGIKAGSSIPEPAAPVAEGYVFKGWYKDETHTRAWDFANDIVQEDTVLYARWSVCYVDSDFTVSEILPVYYTGKALKPAVQVFDGDTLLKVNRDYKVTYKNNIQANQISKSDKFNEQLPHVIIEGKGNYEGTVRLNFDIRPAVIGDGSTTPAQGVKLNYSDQLVINARKAVNPFKSISLGKSMKLGQDVQITLKAVNARAADGSSLSGVLWDNQIPAGSRGSFSLTVTGIGNYTGSISRTITVSNKDFLLKNARITLGKNLKSIHIDTYLDLYGGSLQPGYYDSKEKIYYEVHNGVIEEESYQFVDKDDIFTVKCGKQELICGRDFTVSYENDQNVGMAVMTIHGIGSYSGSKSITFRLTGKVFSEKTVLVEGLEDIPYTGEPITQNKVWLTYVDEDGGSHPLVYGTDYKISYSKNINRGTATIVFTAVGDSGYQGSLKKTFKILPEAMENVDLDESIKRINVEYDKAGAQPRDEVILKNNAGKTLVYGKDYTLSYRNNKAVAAAFGEDPPTIIVKGRGNYSGQMEIPFTINKAALDGEKISIAIKEVAYDPQKEENYEYKPSVIIKDGKKTLSAGTDYRVEYINNTQAAYEKYYVHQTATAQEDKPVVRITANAGGNYKLAEAIVLELPVYQSKFSAKNLHVVISSVKYTGSRCTPEVEVYYAPGNNASAAKGLTSEAEIIRLGLIKLEATDYRLEYGSNISSGKNKGTVTIIGNGMLYGGSAAFKFNIGKRNLDIF